MQAKAWNIPIYASVNKENNARIDVAFVIDESYSMDENDPQKKKSGSYKELYRYPRKWR